MPYRRRTRRSGRTRRRRGGRKAVRRAVRKMRTQGMSFFKIRTVPTLTSDVTGDLYYSFSSTNPANTTNPNGAGYANACGDWTNLVTLYDNYRVFAVKLKYMPILPNNVSGTTIFQPMYVYQDYDSTTPVTNISDINEYENCKIKNLFRPWTVYRKIPKSVNLATNSSIVTFGWMDIANPQHTGHIGCFSENQTASTAYGVMQVTYYVACKNRR